jgi:outer membrane receptor protein involved in Fe transport
LKQSSIFRSIALVGLMLTMLLSMSFAQTSKGSITGIVTDSTGAVVLNATVTATAANGGETRSATTGSNGAYVISALNPGEYVVTVAAQGFATVKTEHVDVRPAITATVNVVAKIATAGDSVTVEATAAIELQTTSGEISHDIPAEEIQGLPLSGLNPIALALTQPGVTDPGGRGFSNGVNFSVNGTRPRSNNFLLDGFDNNDTSIQGQAYQPSNLEAVGEVVVLTNSYNAEYGRGGGSVTNVTYKGGNNSFHGSVYELHQNSALDSTDAADKFNQSPKAKYHDNTFGFSLGGPIKKDKLFYFGTYQWDRYLSSANGGVAFRMPTQAGYDFLKTNYGNNTQIQKLLTAVGSLRGLASVSNIGLGPDPLTGIDRGTVQTGLVARTNVPVKSNDDNAAIRVDWIASQKDTVTFRYIFDDGIYTPDFFANSGALPGFDTWQGGRTQNLGILETHSFSPNVVNEFRMSYGRIRFGFNQTADTLKNPLVNSPQSSISGLFTIGMNTSFPQGRTHNTYQYQDAVNWSKGTHNFKFGADLSRIQEYDVVPFNRIGTVSYLKGGVYTGLGNFMDDFTGQSGTATIQFGDALIRPFVFNQSYYGQDTWRVRSNLTLTYGVRYEYGGTPDNVLKYPAVNFATAATDPFPTRVEHKADKGDIAPRLGISYTPKFATWLFGNDKTVLRAGYGWYYDSFFNNIMSNTAATSPNVVGGTIQAGAGRGFANASSLIPSITPALSGKATVNSINAGLHAPRTDQWNVNIERELPGNFLLTTAYVGTRGLYLYVNDQGNPGANFVRSNPARGAMTVRTNNGDSIYHGASVKLDRRFQKGLLFRTSYTWSKMIDTGSEVFAVANAASSQPQVLVNGRAGERGLSSYDHRHRLVMAYVYDIPMFKGATGLTKALAYPFTGWQTSGTWSVQSGDPETVFSGFDANGDLTASDRPDYGSKSAPFNSYAYEGSIVGGTAGTFYDGRTLDYTSVSACDPTKVINGSCMVPVAASSVRYLIVTHAGNVGRNTQVGPGSQNATFSISRAFSVPGHERHALNFKMEMFNPFNHSNLSTATYNLQDPDFGDAKVTEAGHRQIRFWLKYTF